MSSFFYPANSQKQFMVQPCRSTAMPDFLWSALPGNMVWTKFRSPSRCRRKVARLVLTRAPDVALSFSATIRFCEAMLCPGESAGFFMFLFYLPVEAQARG